ncbi:hypothetical protein ALC60_05829 [Trachymyrmex zeteki]|uniref:Uncharacterized protein n=1 Tax=Mycetomoellerius zeteki TaxID=64791 RepID=A0A151X4I9_9HYME|nr:hypothetical protein ALC60_05829 [Trachymyrmex zeteki]
MLREKMILRKVPSSKLNCHETFRPRLLDARVAKEAQRRKINYLHVA